MHAIFGVDAVLFSGNCQHADMTAQIVMAFAAIAAEAAGNGGFYGNLVAGGEPFHTFADGRDRAARLMAECQRAIQRPIRQLSFLIKVEIRSADSDIIQMNLQLASPWLRDIALCPFQSLLSRQHTNLHSSFHLKSPPLY